MQHTISALVRNQPGVLAEMALVFKEQGVNILSISSGATEAPEIARMVISVECSDAQVKEITALVGAMDFVIQMDDLARREFVDRELLLIKVNMDRETTGQIMQVLEVFRASVVGMGQETITAEVSGDQDRVNGLIKMLAPYGIRSMCRSGMIALKRGDD
ncbi:MAG: acetolactate synthase small subunit [Desulfovibrionaceae bacterium]